MAFRSILLNKATKINLDLNNIVVVFEEDKYYINLDEINVIVIEDARCLVSLKLITEISKKGITMIFVDEKHMPVSAIETLYNNARAAKRYKEQISWDKETTIYLWTEIVKRKIKLQRENLKQNNNLNKIEIIDEYIKNITLNDTTNREGLASRTYFKEFFDSNFKRFNEDITNFALNYAYQIIRAKISQEIVSSGFNPCLGINHTSEYNSFNLADDFIEVYRPIVDYFVSKILEETLSNTLTPSIKKQLLDIINKPVRYNNQNMKLYLSIPLYIQNMFNFLTTGDINKIIFPEPLYEVYKQL